MAPHEHAGGGEPATERTDISSSQTDNHGRARTGDDLVFLPRGIVPFVDVHMHIESLNCTPMPLSWSKAYFVSNLAARQMAIVGLFTQKLKGKSRKEMYDTTTSWLIKKAVVHDFGQIGQLPTQDVANIYRAEVIVTELLASIHWAIDMEESEVRSDLHRAAQELCIYDLVNDRQEAFRKFLDDTRYYFQGNEPFHMSVCLPMDFTHSHFWGRFGLPMQLTDVTNNSFYYFEEFINVVIDREHHAGIEGYYIGYDAIDYDPWLGPEKQIMDYDFDLKKYCDDFFDYLDFAAENDSGLFRYPEKDIDAFILFEETPGEIEDIMQQIKRKDSLPRNRQSGPIRAIKSKIQELRNKFYAVCAPNGTTQKPYLHFLNNVPGSDASKYEAYDTQLFHHEIAAMRYPYKMLPFYHYDPRRHMKASPGSAPSPENMQRVIAGESLFTFAQRHARIHGISDPAQAAETIWNHSRNRRFHTHTWHHPDRVGTRLSRLIYVGDGNYETYTDDRTYTNKWRWIIIHPGEEFYVPGSSTMTSADLTNAVAEKVEKLVENHAFFLFDGFSTNGLSNDSFMLSKFSKMMTYEKILRLKPAGEINAAYLQNELEENMTLNDEVFAKMVQNPDADRGIFWGIKMYSELGYEPGDYETYPHLEEFYAFCESNQVPITVHCSHHGMTIGDTHIYKKHVFKNMGWTEKAEWDLLETIDWVDATCVAPKKLDLRKQKQIMLDAVSNNRRLAYGWERDDIEEKFHEDRWGNNFSEYESYDPKTWDKVLAEYTDLKLNLAHFSGFTCMVKKPGSFDWRDEIGELVQNNKYVYTDISNLLSDVEGVPTMIAEIPVEFSTNEKNFIRSVYQYIDGGPYGLGYYYQMGNLSSGALRRLEYIYRKHDLINDDIKTQAEELKRLLETYPKLKERLMVGTDWYMGETSKFSPGLNLARIFYLMRALTKEIGEIYDCWYQFAIINTLRFLGLLDQDAEPDNSPLETELLERYKERMENVLQFEADWQRQSSITEPSEHFTIMQNFHNNFLKLKQMRIKKSNEIKKDGEILITT